MASEFDSRISQIQTGIDKLTTSLKEVESAVEGASREFHEMSRNAESINQVASSVSKLERLVDRLEKSPFTQKLKEQVTAMNAELQKLDTSRLQTVTAAIQAQTQAQKGLNQAQININGNFRRTKEIVDQMIASLGALSSAAESLSAKTSTSMTNIGEAMGSITAHEKQIQAVVGSLNALDPGRYDQTATALKAVADAAERISKVKLDNLNIKQPKTASSGPTDAAKRYAEEHNIDLSKYEGNVTLRQLRADTQKAPSTSAPASNAIATEVQRRIDNYNSLYAKSQQIDKALAAISEVQNRVFEQAATQKGVTDPKIKQEFQSAIIGKDRSKQYSLAQEHRGTFLDVKQLYEYKLSKESIETDIAKLENISAGDEKALLALAEFRKRLSEKALAIKKSLGNAGQSIENLPNFSIAGTIAKTSTGFSEQVYRPAQYGISQFGAALNSITQIAQGLRRGGIGGALDATGGVLKGINTASNTAAYFGLGGKGFGEVFSNSRSKTLMDLIETVVGLKTGYNRSPLQSSLGGLQAQERTKESYISGIKVAQNLGGPPEFMKQLENELEKSNKELAELRKAIRAYKEVLLAEANKEESESKGKQLGRNQPQARLNNVDYERTAQELHAQLSEKDKLLSIQAQQSLQRFGQGTGFGSSGGAIITSDVNKIARQAYTAASIPSSGTLQGVNIPAYADEARNKAAFTSVVSTNSKQIAQTLVHEITHDIVEQARLAGKDLYSTNAHGGGAKFDNTELDQLALLRKFRLNTSEGRKELYASSRGTSGEEARMLNATQQNSDYRNYLFNPSEIFAHIGEALVSENKELESSLRKIYGPELFEKVQKELAAKLPDVFSEEPLKALQSRFATLDKEINSSIATVGGKASFSGVVEKIQALAQNLLEAFTQTLGPLGDNVTRLITQFFGDVGIGGSATANASISPGGGNKSVAYFDKYFTELLEFAPRNIKHLADTINGQRTLSQTAAVAGQALADPKATAQAAGQKLNNLNVRELANSYASKIIRDIDFPLGLVGSAIKNSGLPDAIFRKLSQTVENVALGKSQPGSFAGKAVQELLRVGVESQLPTQVSFRDQLNEYVRGRTGKNIQAGSFQQSAQLNPMTGMTEFSLSAKTADGAMVSLNGHLDEFGRKKITDPAKGMSEVTRLVKEFFGAIPRQLGYQLTYSLTNAVQQAFSQILSIQDELSEISSMSGVGPTGPAASAMKYDFLHRSVQTAQFTGQGFDEAVQTNLKNYKILGSVTDQGQRADLSNQLSKVQLGAQTAFGISLEQSLEAIPAILTSIGDGMEGVEDPVQRTTQSIEQLQEVMDRMVVAQRASGASGDEMITVFARLSASAKEYSLTNEELINLVAASSVAIGKGSDETSNVLRTLLEGTYSEENQGALKKFGITTKVFNQDTGKIQNKDFNEVLDQLTKFVTSPETRDQAAQLYQVFGGPKLAPDIGKVIRGYATNEPRLAQAQGQNYNGDNFDQIVAQKSQNLQGSLKKLGAAGTELFNTFLVGTGAMDSATKFFDRIADSAGRLTEFFSQHGKEIKGVFDFISNFLKYNLIGALAKDVNVFSPVAKGFGTVKVGISSAISGLVDFGREGDSSSNRLLKGLKLLGTVFNDIEKEITGASGAMKQLGSTAVTTATQVSNAVHPRPAGPAPTAMYHQNSMFEFDESGAVKNKPYTQMSMFGDDDEAARINARMSLGVIPSTAQGSNTRRPGMFGFLGNTFNRLSTANPAYGGLSSWWANNKSPLRNAAVNVGDNAGSMLAPMGFDLMTGGLNKSNIINTVGAGIAGTFLGSITASPQLGLVGYGMAKSFLDSIDFSKFFGASEKEMESFGAAIAEGIRKSNLTPEQRTLEEKSDKGVIAQESAISQSARANFNKLDQTLGLTQFDQSYAKFINAQSAANRVFLKSILGEVSSKDIDQYKRLVINKESPLDAGDQAFLDQQKYGGTAKSTATAQVYRDLGTDALRDIYVKSNVTDPTKFLQMFQTLQEGKGDLLKNKDIREVLLQLTKGEGVQAKTEGLDSAGGHVVDSLETANEIIKRINDNLVEFNVTASKMKDLPLGITEYGEFGKKTTALDEKFAPQLAAIKSGKITGDDAKRILEQYDKSRASLTSMPQTLQQIMPLAQDLGLNTKGLEQKLYGLGAEGQGQFTQRFGQAQQSNQFVQDYEARQRALKQYESSDLYKAKDAAILKEHETLKKALATDQARYVINKQYLDLVKEQANVLLDQADAVQKQNQTRQLISAGTPATFNPMSIFDTKGLSASQINKAIEAALAKQKELEKLSPGYKKYFGEQQFLMQGRGGFKPVTGIDQGFVQEALQTQQSQMAPPSMEDLSQFSDVQVQKILDRARGLQGQAVALNPDLAGKYDSERILIYRKNNQLLQQTGLSQEYLKLAIQENTKSQDQLRGHYNLPSNYKAPTVWDYYNEGGKETGDVNFAKTTGQGSMVPLSFAQQLATEMMNAAKTGGEGADLSAITTTTGPGGSGKPRFYSGGSAPVYSEPVPIPLPDTVSTEPRVTLPNARTEIESFKHETVLDAARARKAGAGGLQSPDRADGKKPSTSPLDMIKDALEKTKQSLGLTDQKVKDLGAGAAVTVGALTGFSGAAAALALNTNAFNSAVTGLLAKVQGFDLVKALKSSNVVIQVTVNGQPATAAAPVINNASGGGGAALTGGPTAKTRIS